MPTANVPSPHAGPPGPGRGGRRELLFGHLLPALVAAVFVAGQAALLGDSIAQVASRGAVPADLLVLANRALGLAYFGLLAVLFVVRLPALGSDRRPLVVVVAMGGSYSILAGAILAPLLGATSHGVAWVVVSNLLLLAGGALSLWSLAHLRRSFSILPEARRLVVDGPYALTRNPLYLGELVAGCGVLLPSFGPVQAVALLVFIACQALRIGWEERVLETRLAPEFGAYRERVPRLLPIKRRQNS